MKKRRSLRMLCPLLLAVCLMALTLAAGAAVFATEDYEYDETVYQYTYTYTDEDGEQEKETPAVRFTNPISQTDFFNENGDFENPFQSSDGLEGYYLTENITITNPLLFSDGKMYYIDLNGYTVTHEHGAACTEEGAIVVNNTATLNLFDTSEKGTGRISGNEHSIIYINDNGSLNLYGGKICDGNIPGLRVYKPGGVWNVLGTFNIYGGEISENKSPYAGGIINASNSTLNIYGGSISKNEVTRDDLYTGAGGILNFGILNMYNGNIIENVHKGGSAGGVSVEAPAKITIYGGSISNNTSSQGNGGGVDVEDGTESFKMYGGEISGNSAGGNGGGVMINSGVTFDLHGGSIVDNTARLSGGGIATYYTGSIVNMHGGSISRNTTVERGGGGVYNYHTGATFNMYDGDISDNTAQTSGGGIENCSDAIVNISGGSISGNRALSVGSDEGGGGIYNYDGAVANISGGSISGNRAKKGGGIFCLASKSVSLNMEGGEIIGNIAEEAGGGVYNDFFGDNKTELTFKGDPVIYSNILQTNNERYNSDVCLNNNKIKIADVMEEGAKIGVHFDGGGTGTVTDGFGTHHSGDADTARKYFIANTVSSNLMETQLTSEGGTQEIKLVEAAHTWNITKDEEINDEDDKKDYYTINCKMTHDEGYTCDYEENHYFTFDVSDCGGDFKPSGSESAKICATDNKKYSDYIEQVLSISYNTLEENDNISASSMNPPTEIGKYSAALQVISSDSTVENSAIDFTIDPIDIKIVLQEPKGGDDLSGFIGSFSGGNEGYTLPDAVESVTVTYQDEEGTEIGEGTAGYDTEYTAVVTLKLKEGYPENSVSNVITINGNEIFNFEKEIGDDGTVSSVEAIYGFKTAKRTIPVDKDGDGTVEPGDQAIEVPNDDGNGIYEANVDGDADTERLIPVDIDDDVAIEHYVPSDMLIDDKEEADKDSIYTPVDENGEPQDEPKYYGKDEIGNDGEPDKFIKLTDENNDGIYEGNTDGDGDREKYIPVDKDGDGNVNVYVEAEDSDGDGIYGDDSNGDGNYDGDSDENGEEDNHYIPVDTDGDGDVDTYIQAEDSDGDGIYGDDANNDGEYDGPANEDGNEDNQYIPVDTDGDGKPNHYVPDGVLKDSDNDGIYEGEDDKEYIPVDKDGDGDIDIFIDKEKLTEGADSDNLKEVDINGDNTKEELIAVDMDGDGSIDHYIPDDALVDEDKDGIYTPADPNVKDENNRTPEYIGVNEDDDNEPEKFIKVEDSDGDGVYGDDANGNGKYDDEEENDGKKDNKYIPVDTDYNPNTPDEFIEVTPNEDGSYTDKNGTDSDTSDDKTYIPVDKDGDGDNEFIEVTPNEDDGSYTDENGTGSDTSDDKTYIPVDADADGDVDEFVEVKDIDGKYKDDDDGDEIFGGEGDYTYKPINDDGDDKPDRYVTEDAVAEDGHAHTVGTPATCTEAAKCGVENCGEYYGKPLGHNYGDWRKVNGTKHERECEREGCEYAMEGNHYPELECGANAASCDICGATAAGDHTFSKEWSSDKTGHWKGCIHCGTKDPESVATHNYPNKNAGDGVSQTCLTCGYGGHITRVTADDSFEDYYIPKTLKKKFPTVDAIKTAMKDKAKEGNSDLSDDKVWLFDAVLEYSIDGGITWKPASEDYFPKKADGITYDVLPVKLPVPEETNIADYEYKVYHMFTSNKFKEVGGPGYIEQPIVTEEKGDAECDRGYISFYVRGLSPIMVVWEKTASDTAGGGGCSTGPEEGNGPEPRTIPDQDGDNKPEPDTNDDGIYDGTRDDDKKYVKDEDGNIEEVTDPDGDGIYDGEDRDGDGKPDKRYIADQDGDGIPEPDTDGDGIFEGTKDDKRYGTGENDRRNKDNSDKKTYEFVDGKLIWIKGSTKDLTFTIDAPAKKFKKLIIGGETVGKGEYSYVSGSTIVTVDADYLNSLKLGSYEVKAVYTDGRAETTLKVKAAAGAATSGTDTGSGNSAGTGDESNLLLWMMIATAAAAGGVGTLIPRRRRSH